MILYFAGFVYQYSIDDRFGENLFASSIPLYDYLFLAFPVFQSHIWQICAYLFGIAVVLVAVRYFESKVLFRRDFAFLAGALTPLVLVGATVGASFLPMILRRRPDSRPLIRYVTTSTSTRSDLH